MNLSHFVLAIFSLKAQQRRQSGLQILFLCLNLTNLLFQQGKFCFIYFVLWKKCRGTWMYTVKPSDCICSNFYMRLIFFWILTAWGLCICKWGMFFPWDFQNFNKMALCNYMYVCFRITFEWHNSLPRDREIQFFELSTFEPYCQITGLETTPLRLDYW